MEKVRAISRKLSKSKEARALQDEIPCTSKKSTRKHKKKKKRQSKDEKIDGESVSHLVRSGTYKSSKSDDEKEGKTTEDGKSEAQDNYLLTKLFKRSGVHSAVQHDVIVDGGGDDYILVEGEAERVAKEAVQSLKESRRQCFRAEAGVPTWTGAHGHSQRNRGSAKERRQPREMEMGPCSRGKQGNRTN